ncbi:MAG: type II toxin-antitoxin system Phd/YefM family antitoxin [Caulobacter sp.]|nr:type II toxin-antitoxin system Phd/YefM family antitoxin [Caulobacter sp.]
MTAWKMETAKARLSEVVRQAQAQGPQRITIRGEAAAVVLSQDDYARLTHAGDDNWVDRFRRNFTGDIDPVRDDDVGRDFDL